MALPTLRSTRVQVEWGPETRRHLAVLLVVRIFAAVSRCTFTSMAPSTPRSDTRPSGAVRFGGEVGTVLGWARLPTSICRCSVMRTVLVTVGGRGLGRATAEKLAVLGHRVILVARTPAEAETAIPPLEARIAGLVHVVLGILRNNSAITREQAPEDVSPAHAVTRPPRDGLRAPSLAGTAGGAGWGS